MNRRSTILLVLGLGLVVLGWLLRPGPPPPVSPVAPVAGPVAPPAPPPVASRTPTPYERLRRCSLRVAFEDPAGAPVEYVQFVVRPPDQRRPTRSSITGEDGQGKVEQLLCQPFDVLAEDHQGRFAPALVQVEASELPDPVVVQLRTRCEAVFRVVDPEGRPVREVRGGDWPGRTEQAPDLDGLLRLPLCPGSDSRAVFEAPGFGLAVVPLPDDEHPQTVVLEPAEPIDGVVLSNLEPDELEVASDGAIGRQACQHQGEDRWRCPGAARLPVDITTSCGGAWAGSPGVRRTSVLRPEAGFLLDCEAPFDEPPPEEPLVGEGTVRVQVLREGVPEPDVQLLLDHVGARRFGHTGRTGPDGGYVFEGVAEGSWLLRASTGGAAAEPAAVELGDGGVESVLVRLRPGPDCAQVTARFAGEDLFLVYVPWDSPPWQAGLRPWQRVLSIAGRDVVELFQAEVAALLSPAPGEQVELRVDAGGQEQSVRWVCES